MMSFAIFTPQELADLAAGKSVERILLHDALELGNQLDIGGYCVRVVSIGTTKNQAGKVVRQRVTLQGASA